MLTRNKCKYAVNRSLTERYRRSAIPDMQRKLNKSLMEQRKLMNNIVTSEQYRDFRGIHICGIVYHICGIVYHVCGNFDPQMWYSIPHMWYTQIFFFDFDNFSKNFPMGILKKFFWILIVRIISEFWA